MVDLNDAFAGKDPGFMDGLFPEGGWREMLERSKTSGSDWGWFWDRFAPNGALISEDPPGSGFKSASEMPGAVMKSLVTGFIESEKPDAKYKSRGRLIHYWLLKKKGLPADLVEYSTYSIEGGTDEGSMEV